MRLKWLLPAVTLIGTLSLLAITVTWTLENTPVHLSGIEVFETGEQYDSFMQAVQAPEISVKRIAEYVGDPPTASPTSFPFTVVRFNVYVPQGSEFPYGTAGTSDNLRAALTPAALIVVFGGLAFYGTIRLCRKHKRAENGRAGQQSVKAEHRGGAARRSA